MPPARHAQKLAYCAMPQEDEREDSIVSVDEDVPPALGHITVVLGGVDDVLKPNLPGDEEPTFLLENCFFVALNEGAQLTPELVSILGVKPGDRKIVGLGVLVIDDENRQYLIDPTKSYNRGPQSHTIEKLRIDYDGEYAIGDVPPTLWVGQRGKWLEVRPAEPYKETYLAMMHLIGVHFANVTFFANNRPKKIFDTNSPKLHLMLSQYAMSQSGTALTLHELLALIVQKHSRVFLLTEMTKLQRHDPLWQYNELFQFLGYLEYVYDPEHDPYQFAISHIPAPGEIENIVNESDAYEQMAVDDEAYETMNIDDADPEPVIHQPTNQLSTRVIHPNTTAALENRKSSATRHYGPYASSLYPNGATSFPDISTTVNVVAMHAVESGIRDISKLNLAFLAQSIYQNFNINFYQAVPELIRHYRKEILAALPSALKKSPLYTELSKPGVCKIPASSKDQKIIDARKMLLELVSGEKAIVRRGQGRPGQNKQTPENAPQKVVQSAPAPAVKTPKLQRIQQSGYGF